jgi:hypothetical protein
LTPNGRLNVILTRGITWLVRLRVQRLARAGA